jgi:hypothetical protein
MAGAAAIVVAVLGGGVLVWQSGVLGRLTGTTDASDQAASDLADIANCVGPYTSALMMEQDGAGLTEADLEQRAKADCAAMTPEQRAAYVGTGVADTMADNNAAGSLEPSDDPLMTRVLGKPSVRLWYPESQTYSDEIVGNPDFALWNIIIGEGSAKEPTDVAKFRITVEPRPSSDNGLVLMTAKGASGQVLATTEAPLPTSAEKNWVELTAKNIGCAGLVTFTAKYRDETVSAILDFDCGE